jgi:hypothetical protein
MSFSRGRFLSLLLPSSTWENINVCAKSLPGLHMPKMMIIYRRELIHSKLKRSERAKIFTLPPVEFLAIWFITVSQNCETSEASSNFTNFFLFFHIRFAKQQNAEYLTRLLDKVFDEMVYFCFVNEVNWASVLRNVSGFPSLVFAEQAKQNV